MKQLTAKIVKNERAGKDFCRMKLASPYLGKISKPGQFVEIRCTKGVDPLLRRPLGCHRITAGGIEVLYEIVGKGTELLSRMKAGCELDIIGPLGNGFEPNTAGEAVLVAGGIGVAPLVALAEKFASLPVSRLTSLEVFIGAKTKAHLLCENEFKKIGAKVFTATEDGSKGCKGLITDLLKKELYNRPTGKPANRQTIIYACGPTGMLKAVAQIARSKKVPCQVSLEERMACGVGVCLGCPVKVKPAGEYAMVCKDGPVFNAEDIVW